MAVHVDVKVLHAWGSGSGVLVGGEGGRGVRGVEGGGLGGNSAHSIPKRSGKLKSHCTVEHCHSLQRKAMGSAECAERVGAGQTGR